jgi:hypothetical protein
VRNPDKDVLAARTCLRSAQHRHRIIKPKEAVAARLLPVGPSKPPTRGDGGVFALLVADETRMSAGSRFAFPCLHPAGRKAGPDGKRP